jgi:mono/diheme cytochrome c family protein
MRQTTLLGSVLAMSLAVWVLGGSGAAQSPPAAPPPGSGVPANGPTPPVEFTPEFLGDPKIIQRGRGVWQARCQFCHGRSAYPGKAPKLDPSRYTPAFVYDRVANGFQGMPPWRHEFSMDDLKAVVAFVLSKEFSN